MFDDDNLKRVFVHSTEALLSHFVLNLCSERNNQTAFTLVRGVRSFTDFESEFMMARINRDMDGLFDTVFFPTDDSFDCVSSSMVKELCSFGEDVSRYTSPMVEEALIRKTKGEL